MDQPRYFLKNLREILNQRNISRREFGNSTGIGWARIFNLAWLEEKASEREVKTITEALRISREDLGLYS